jgi:WD40 repeat protein
MTLHSSSHSQPNLDSAWLRRVHLVEEFEEHWQQHGTARIPDFLARATAHERTPLLLELIKIDLEYRWGRGEPCHVEQYCREFPELGDAAKVPQELILEELRVRKFCGCDPSTEELAARFPAQEALLGSLSTLIGQRGDSTADDDHKQNVSAHNLEGESGTPLLPQSIGRYEIRRAIGRGGFATVFCAWDAELRREVAIKIPRRELFLVDGANDRMQREAQSAARLRHPAIVPIYEVGQHDGWPYIVYALLPGPSLAELLARDHPTAEQSAHWIERLAEALDYAHQCGIVHRDLKPSNILLDADGQPALVDFGLALDNDATATLTRHGDILGTPAYMSPELARGQGHEADGRTDIYSLGVVLYEMLAGRVPFQGSAISILNHVIHDEPETPRRVRAGVPIDLETICLKAMAKEPNRRYTTAGDMAADLRAFLEHRPIAARRLGPIARLSLTCRRNPRASAAIGGAMGISLIIGLYSFVRVVQERNRFRKEREVAIANLYDSLIREGRAIRLSRATGYREVAWERLHRARNLDTAARDVELLRQEAAACLGDFVGSPPMIWQGLSKPGRYVTAISFSPNGGLIAIGCTGGWLGIFETTSRRQVADLVAHQSGVFHLSFSHDGQKLASIDDQGKTHLWQSTPASPAVDLANEPSNWALARTFETRPSAEGGQIVAAWCALTPDGQYLLACSKGEPTVSMWNVSSGERAAEFQGLAGELFVRGALSRDGKTLVAAYRSQDFDGVLVWDVQLRQLKKKLPITRQAIIDTVFNHDGTFLACACNVGTFLIGTQDWQQRTFLRSDDQFFTIDFHPDHPMLALPVARSGKIRLWDVANNREIAALDHPGGPHSVAFSHDGSFLASATGMELRLWNLRGNEEKRTIAAHTGVVQRVRFIHDGKVLASASVDGNVKLWDSETGELLSSLSAAATPGPSVSSISYTPRLRRLAAADWNGNVAVFDISSPQQPKRIATLVDRELGHIVFDVAYSPDGEYLAAAGQNGVWLWKNDKQLSPLTEKGSVAVIFSQDAKRLAWIEKGSGIVHVWNLEASQQESIPSGYSGAGGLAFFPDSENLLTVTRSHSHSVSLQALNVRTKNKTMSQWNSTPMEQADFESGLGFAVSPNQKWIAVKAANTAIWEIETHRRLLSLAAESAAVEWLDWSPDCRRLALALTDGQIVLWDIPAVRRELKAIGLDWE